MEKLPIMEHTYTLPAVIEPSKLIPPLEGMPEKAVVLFYHSVIDKLIEKKLLTKINLRKSEVGLFPIYAIEHKGEKIAVFNPGLGAPCAAGFYEELIALGVKKTVACGSAGVLKRELSRGEIVIVQSAVRDEGTSYHYLEPAREVHAQERVLRIIVKTLSQLNIPYLKGKTWTTDAFYRETHELVAKRIAEGCLTVEMEASAMMAVSQFRGVEFGQLLSCGDDVSGQEWDARFHPEAATHKEKVFWAALECCFNL